MATFLSSAINKIDKKGRVSVPSAFRSAVAKDSFHGIAIYPALGVPCLEGADTAFFEDLSRKIHEKHNAVSQSGARLARRLLGRMETLSFDPEGRVLISAQLRAYAGISDRAHFVGIGPKFQIWDPDKLVAHDHGDDEALALEAENLGPIFTEGF